MKSKYEVDDYKRKWESEGGWTGEMGRLNGSIAGLLKRWNGSIAGLMGLDC